MPEKPEPPSPGAFQRGMAALEKLEPVSEVHKNFVDTEAFLRARAVFYGYDPQQAGDDESPRGEAMIVVKQMADEDVDELLSVVPEWTDYIPLAQGAGKLRVYLIYLG